MGWAPCTPKCCEWNCLEFGLVWFSHSGIFAHRLCHLGSKTKIKVKISFKFQVHFAHIAFMWDFIWCLYRVYILTEARHMKSGWDCHLWWHDRPSEGWAFTAFHMVGSGVRRYTVCSPSLIPFQPQEKVFSLFALYKCRFWDQRGHSSQPWSPMVTQIAAALPEEGHQIPGASSYRSIA